MKKEMGSKTAEREEAAGADWERDRDIAGIQKDTGPGGKVRAGEVLATPRTITTDAGTMMIEVLAFEDPETAIDPLVAQRNNRAICREWIVGVECVDARPPNDAEDMTFFHDAAGIGGLLGSVEVYANGARNIFVRPPAGGSSFALIRLRPVVATTPQESAPLVHINAEDLDPDEGAWRRQESTRKGLPW